MRIVYIRFSRIPLGLEYQTGPALVPELAESPVACQ